jgi:hypothetical protein
MAAAENKEEANQQWRDRRQCGAFAKTLVKFTDNYSYPSVGPSVRMEQRYSAGRVSIHFCVSEFY